MTQKQIEYQRRYRAANREVIAEHARRIRLLKKDIVYNHYNRKCACCGELEEKFLSIDHINNDGYLNRKHGGGSSSNLIQRIIRQGFPDTYQILCMNCNCGKARNNGICPHQLN